MDAGASGIGFADPKNMVQKTIERSHVYGFLATIYRAEPTADVLRQIREPPFLRALSGAGVTLDDDFLDRPEEQLLSDLSLEYTRLFIGPGKHLSPHESVHIPGDSESLWGKSTVAVKQFLESVGVECRPDYHGMPDHISVELEFMQEVTYIEAQAWQRRDKARAANCRRVERAFMHEHLARWVPGFCRKVATQAQLPFYREMANLTKAFIEQEDTGLQQCG